MRIWPWLLDLSIVSAERKPVHLWLPLILLWPLLLAIVTPILALSVLVDFALIIFGRPYHHYTRLLAGFFGLLCDLRGMVVRVHADDNDVDIAFY